MWVPAAGCALIGEEERLVTGAAMLRYQSIILRGSYLHQRGVALEDKRVRWFPLEEWDRVICPFRVLSWCFLELR
jgi:hypothetical protein